MYYTDTCFRYVQYATICFTEKTTNLKLILLTLCRWFYPHGGPRLTTTLYTSIYNIGCIITYMYIYILTACNMSGWACLCEEVQQIKQVRLWVLTHRFQVLQHIIIKLTTRLELVLSGFQMGDLVVY